MKSSRKRMLEGKFSSPWACRGDYPQLLLGSTFTQCIQKLLCFHFYSPARLSFSLQHAWESGISSFSTTCLPCSFSFYCNFPSKLLSLSLSLSIALSTMRSLTGSLLNNQWYGLALECYEARKKDIKISIYVDLEHLSRDITKKKM